MSSPYPFLPNGPLIPSDINNSAATFTKDVVTKGDVQLGTTVSKIGFFGKTPVAQPTSASVTDYATLKVALQNLGLIGS